MPKIICIGGSPSSGTTLFADLIDSIPGILCGPELNIFCIKEAYEFSGSFKQMTAENRIFKIDSPYAGKSRFFNAKHLHQVGLNAGSLNELVKNASSFENFLSGLSAAFAKFRKRECAAFADKTPLNVVCAEDFCRYFPDGLFIHVVRDLEGTVESLMRRGYTVFQAGMIWLEQTARGRIAAEKYQNAIEVRYEDLLERPFEIMAGIAERAGIHAGPAEIQKEFERNEYRKSLPRPGSWRVPHFTGKTEKLKKAGQLSRESARFLESLFLYDEIRGSSMASVRELKIKYGYPVQRVLPAISYSDLKDFYHEQGEVSCVPRESRPISVLTAAGVIRAPCSWLLLRQMFRKAMPFSFSRLKTAFQRACFDFWDGRNSEAQHLRSRPFLALILPARNFKNLSSFFRSLGMPQIACYRAGDKLPASVKIRLFCDAESEPQEAAEPAWQMRAFSCSAKQDFSIPAEELGINSGRAYIFKANRTHFFVPCDAIGMSKEALIFKRTAYYALRFLRKSGLVTVTDRILGILLAACLDPLDGEFAAELRAVCGSDLTQLLREIPQEESSFIRAVQTLVSGQSEAGTVRIPASSRTKELCRAGITALAANEKDAARHIWDKLNGNFDPEAGYFKADAASKNYYYGPDLCLFAHAMTEDANKFPVIEKHCESYEWNLREKSANGELRLSDLLDEHARLFSDSLFVNLQKILELPGILSGKQYVLEGDSYGMQMPLLKRLWAGMLKRILNSENLPALEIFPWPEKTDFALSLRYDVDRPLRREHAGNIVKLCERHRLDSCTSWYFFTNRLEENKLLRGFRHEAGFHILGGENSKHILGRGITHHNAPHSKYWRGMAQDMKLAPAYSECLFTQLGRPFSWYEGERALWTVPVHFPMELGTQSRADYSAIFQEKFGQNFQSMLDFGGHIILSSHPDLDQRHMESVLSKLPVERAWPATVSAAVRRCQMTEGIIFFTNNAGVPVLLSQFTIPRLQVRMTLPNGQNTAFSFNLKAGQVCLIQ